MSTANLWYVLSGPDGATNRAKILSLLKYEARTVRDLAERLDIVTKTVRHHLETLDEHDLVTADGATGSRTYRLTTRAKRNWDTVEEITATVVEE